MRYEVRVIDPAHPVSHPVVMTDHSRSLNMAARAVVRSGPGVTSVVLAARGPRGPQRQIARFEKLFGGKVRVKTELLAAPVTMEPHDVFPLEAIRGELAVGA